ncbi:MAG: glutamate N-acetyltransferase / amino-acid N-acetyltransferase, partial [Candidatus Methanocomedens sp.]
RIVSTLEDTLKEIMGSKEVIIMVDLGVGGGCATAWGCDLSYDYVRINAEYTT